MRERPEQDRRGVAAGARLDLAEQLLGSFEPAECAERALEWMAQHGNIRRSLCALADPEHTRLVGIAGFGINPARVSRFVVPLDERDHPMLSAFNAGRPTVVLPGPRGDGRSTPLGPSTCLAVPLGPGSKTAAGPVGLVLLDGRAPVAKDVRWAVDLLGKKLVHLDSFHALADAHRRLASERYLLESITNALTDPMLLTDTEGRLMVANSRAESLFASTESESEGRRRAVALNNMLLSAALTQRVIAASEPARRELLLVDPSDGTDLLFELMTTVIEYPRVGTRLVSILRNVTDLRRATQEIEENYQKLRVAEATVRGERDRLNLVLDSVAEPILVTDSSGNIVLTNAPAERLFVVAPGGPHEDAERAVRANDARFSSLVSNLFFAGSGLHHRREFSLLDPSSGLEIPFEAFSGRILSQHGEVTGLVTILHDRTEAIEKARLYEQLKRASDELEAKVREATSELVRQNDLLKLQHLQLEQASALKSQFLANMSHEFRTPLNAILGYTSMLLEGVGGELKPAQHKQLERVDSNSRHLLTIMNELLDISRIEAGKMPIHLSEFDLAELLAEVMAEAEPIIVSSRLLVRLEMDRPSVVIKSDRQKVKQILLNLLSNALKFTPEGSVTIGTACNDATEEVSVRVIDTGIGIPEEEYERVFEAFSQVDNSPSRQYGGTGLGLTICRRLAAMLGGTITIASRVGEGSTFSLNLPLRLRLR